MWPWVRPAIEASGVIERYRNTGADSEQLHSTLRTWARNSSGLQSALEIVASLVLGTLPFQIMQL